MKKVKTQKSVISFVLVLVLVLSMMPLTAFADMDVDHDRISVATGEPVTLQWDSDTSTSGAIVTTTAINYYPSSFVLYVYNGTTPSGVGVTATFLYNTPGGNAYRIDLPSSASTISVTLANSQYGGSREYVLTCQAPQGSAPGGTTPAYDNGYLPVGQYASGSGWGSIFSDGTNLTGSTQKFLSGYVSTGISLGAAGGYVQFEFANAVENKSTNPYGVDFVIYGNPFNGNPEAGAVKVSTDGAVWYDLAGSLYYDTKSKNNVDVTFKKVTSTSAAFTTVGIYYRIDSGSWTKFTSTTAWWPELTEGYGTVAGISTTFRGSTTVNGVTYDTTNNEITYQDISLIKDTDTTNDYQFGYFDVRANGSSYATAVNPYATTPAALSGGDGYDISWAVNSSGEPVPLSYIKYVRAYTSACLNTTGNAFTVPSIFGETSAEVCGIYTANGTGSGIATTDLVVKRAGSAQNHSSMGTTTITTTSSSLSLSIFSDEPNVFVNGVNVSSSCSAISAYTKTVIFGTGETTKYIQIITQSGTESPYITMFKIVKN
jgi:hypothetical protein